MVIKATIQQQIKSLLLDMVQNQNQENSIDVYSDRLAQIITDAILSAEVTETPFQVIGTSPSGVVTGTASQTAKGTLQ